MTQRERDSLPRGPAVSIFVIVFIDLMGLTIIIPLLPLYAASFGAGALAVGALSAAYPLMQFIGGPLLGGLSDRYGRKPVLMISQAGTFIGFLVLAASNSLPLLFLARMIDGISGGNIATAQASLSDITNERTRAQGLGLIGAAFGLGFIIGPVVSAIALSLSHNDYRVPALIAAAFSLTSIVLSATLFKETLPADKRHQQGGGPLQSLREQPGRMVGALRNPSVGILVALIFLQQTVFGAFQSLFAPFTLNRLGIGGTGNAIFFTYIGLMIVILQGRLIGPLSRKYGERRLIFAGLALLGVGFLILSFTPTQPPPFYSRAELAAELNNNGGTSSGGDVTIAVSLQPPDDSTPRGWLGVAWVLVALTPLSMGSGLLQPSINSLITKRVQRTQVGSILGVSSAFLSAANTVGPLIGGVIFQFLGAAAPFIVATVISAVLFFVARQRVPPGDQPAPSPA